jgi:hypothetical protein
MDSTDNDIALAPLPTDKTLRARKNVLVQLGRFVAINAKMLRIIRRERR